MVHTKWDSRSLALIQAQCQNGHRLTRDPFVFPLMTPIGVGCTTSWQMRTSKIASRSNRRSSFAKRFISWRRTGDGQ
jgi:hypothetical protein